MDPNSLKEAVLAGCEYSYLHDDWVTPLREALDGIGAEQAAWRQAPTRKGIWDIVLHLAAWNENIVERLVTGEHSRPAEGAWPPPSTVQDEEAWAHAQRRLWESLEALHRYIESNPPEALMHGPYGLGDVLCRFIHNAYHIGQVTRMRELLQT